MTKLTLQEAEKLLKDWEKKYWKLDVTDHESYSVDLGVVPNFIRELIEASAIVAEAKAKEEQRKEDAEIVHEIGLRLYENIPADARWFIEGREIVTRFDWDAQNKREIYT